MILITTLEARHILQVLEDDSMDDWRELSDRNEAIEIISEALKQPQEVVIPDG